MDASSTQRSTQTQLVDQLAKLPWWLILILLFGVILAFQFFTNALYIEIFNKLYTGLVTTLWVTFVAYGMAVVIGLLAGLGRVSKNVVIYNLATLYVQVIRGVPILVQIFYVAFAGLPALIGFLQGLGLPVTIQSVPMEWRVIIALAVAYGGFEAETFRAGIESIGRGQMEAARSLGMCYVQAMRYIILPQAIRRILPPLGNDLISMLKDSSLVSVLGVNDITQQARLYWSASFRYPETLNSLAFVYLSLTLILSLFTRWVENRLGKYGN